MRDRKKNRLGSEELSRVIITNPQGFLVSSKKMFYDPLSFTDWLIKK